MHIKPKIPSAAINSGPQSSLTPFCLAFYHYSILYTLYTGIVGALVRGEADFNVDLSESSIRAPYIDYATPHRYSNSRAGHAKILPRQRI